MFGGLIAKSLRHNDAREKEVHWLDNSVPRNSALLGGAALSLLRYYVHPQFLGSSDDHQR